MSSSTALLPGGSNRKNDHPIFLRACHSPWLSVSQKSLVFLRGSLATYLLVSSLLMLHYELEVKKNGWLVVYDLSNIVFGLQTLYAWIVFIWTFMHLYYPHNNDNNSSSISGYTRRFLSPSRRNSNSNEKYFFSIFHWVVIAFPHLVTFVHWVILVPRNEISIPNDEIFDDRLTTFVIFNKYCVNSVVAFIELFILSSIKRSDVGFSDSVSLLLLNMFKPVWNHVVAFAIIIFMYVGWSAIGHGCIGKYTYFFLDHEKIGWEYYWASVAGLVFLSELFFVFVYSVTGVRESMTKKQSEDKSTGYQRLPQ